MSTEYHHCQKEEAVGCDFVQFYDGRNLFFLEDDTKFIIV